MSKLDIIVPVKNEGDNISELVERIHFSLTEAKIHYRVIFVDDHSSDHTVEAIRKASEKYPVILTSKKGKKGKAYSILEGAQIAQTEYVAMIDGDLQYPPEAIPELYKVAKEQGIAVANRKKHKTSLLRRIGSKINILLFERLLHGFKVDTQSGLKVFKKEIIEHLSEGDVTGWALDMPLLHTGLQLGYKIGSHDIEFSERKNGKSQLKFLRASREIATNALKLKLKRKRVYAIKPQHPEKPIGAGLAHRGKRFITHTRLPHEKSAFRTFYPWQKFAILLGLVAIGAGLAIDAKLTAVILIGLLTFIYLIDFLFSLWVMLKSLHFPPEIKITNNEIASLNDNELPLYTILCPLYKEARILPHFVTAIDNLDWPKDKLDVQLLLEEDDKETREAAENLNLPDHFRVLIVPHSEPKTKPKACNFGFAHAKGEYVVIYDAEDRPDPLQLKKAYIGFKKSKDNVVCLQSKLNYYNTHQNWLTKLFTAEYSLWFDLILPGLQSVETAIPLGGTSNHFKARDLAELHAWDAFNVTEDCDLGVRLFREGKKTAIIDSTTYEEANSKFTGWLRQRSRWIKGYMQTYLVHTRNPIQFIKEHGVHALLFQLVIGMRMAFILINPLLWLMTISYFTFYPLVGPQIEALYPAVVFYPAVFLLIFGNFLYFYNYMIGCSKREHWSVIKYVFFVPFYWIMTSTSAFIAFYQLFIKPHYWEKTQHGLHLKEEPKVVERKLPKPGWAVSPAVLGGTALILASVLGNISNFLYNAYLGREVSLEEFGTVSLISSIFALSGILSGAVGKTVTFKVALLFGKIRQPVKEFWSSTLSWTAIFSFFVTATWILASPFLAEFFNIDSILPFLLFAPAWAFILTASVNTGFLSGNLKFLDIGLIVTAEAVAKLALTFALVEAGHPELVYASIPFSIIIAFFLSWLIIYRTKSEVKVSKNELRFPKKFFGTSILTSLSRIAFLSFDVIAAKHFLPATAAGQYALISLTGKIIYFLGSLFTQFITPLISHGEGAQKDTSLTFYKLLGATTLASFLGYVAVGIFGSYTVPFLFGDKALAIVSYLPLYGFAIAGYAVSASIINYHQVKRQYLFPVVGFLFALGQVAGFYLSAKTLGDFVNVVSVLAIAQLGSVGVLHLFYPALQVIWGNLVDFAGIFGLANGNGRSSDKLRILIFNWRDTKHVWAGGAEVYVHELAKRWVAEGHKVTVFCGNDRKNKRNEVVDRVKIIRRGGFYTVYLWAALYYIFRFRGKYDCIVDCENGIPFFTPLYSRVPKVLLIHHVHQEVFRNHLIFPFSYFAMLLESKFMPLVYRNTKLITISESSRADIVNMGWVSKEDIEIVNPGINEGTFRKLNKTQNPSFVYLGRLKHYKNIDVAINAFAKVYEDNRDAKLTIAGFGESLKDLKTLRDKNGLNGAVDFAGYVSEEKKKELLARSWVALQPSSFEGWGITVIEANASGTPVIASKTKGLMDSIVDGKTGILVPPKDAEILAKVMQDLIEEESFRKDLAKNAYAWSKNFRWDASAKKFLSVISGQIQQRQLRVLSKALAALKKPNIS